jgi:hypothetical protein
MAPRSYGMMTHAKMGHSFTEATRLKYLVSQPLVLSVNTLQVPGLEPSVSCEAQCVHQ